MYALIDSNGDGFAEDLVLVFDNMIVSNGVAWHEGSLYISERSKLWRLGDVDAFVYANSNNASYPLADAQLLTEALPDAEAHAAKYIAVSPQGQLYINIGAPCNSCEPGGFQKNATTPMFQVVLTDWIVHRVGIVCERKKGICVDKRRRPFVDRDCGQLSDSH